MRQEEDSQVPGRNARGTPRRIKTDGAVAAGCMTLLIGRCDSVLPTRKRGVQGASRPASSARAHAARPASLGGANP